MKVADRGNARWAVIMGLVVFCLGLMVHRAVADPTWEVDVTVSSTDPGLLPIELTIGVDPAASEDVDSLDAVAPPPPPGPPYLYAYFIAGPTKLFTDIRPDIDEAIVWQGAIWNSEVETFFVTWDPAALPDTGNFLFDDTIDMRETDSVMVTGTWNPINVQFEYLFTITRTFIGTLHEIVISPDPAEIVCEGTQQFTAEGFDEFGNPIETDPVWSVAPEGFGTIDQTGMFTALQGGAGWVIATDGDVVDSAAVTVVAGALADVEVTPSEVTVICAQEQQFTATGYDACGNEVTIDPVWSLSDPDLGMIDETGLFTANQAGTGYVIATADGYADSAEVTVIAGEVVTVSVDPESAIVPRAEQQQFTATGYDDCENEAAFAATWSVDPPGLGTIDANGLFTGVELGAGWVFAEVSAGRFRTNECDPPYLKASDVTACDGEEATVGIELAEAVGPVDAFSMDITYNTAHMTYDTIDVVGYLTDGWTVVGASENTPGVITVGGLTIGAPIAQETSGVLFTLRFHVIGVEGDESLICLGNLVDDFATGYNTCCGEYECPVPPPVMPKDSAYVIVVPREATGFMIEPEEATVQSGMTLAFAGTALGEGFQWDVTDETAFETTDPLGFMVDNMYTAGQLGTWLVTAMYDTFEATAEVTVIPGPLATLEITPESIKIGFNGDEQFTVVGFDVNGNEVPTTPVWSLSTPTIGEIDQTGFFTAGSEVATGYVIATDGDVADSAFVEVVERGEPIGITIYPQDTTVASGQTVTYMAYATDGYVEWDVTDLTIWDSTDSCSVWFDNIYQACFVGTWAVIGLYEFDGTTLADTAIVHVTIGHIVGIEISPETTVVSGSQMAYTAMGFDEAGNEEDVTEAADFMTTDPGGFFTDNIYTAHDIGTWEIMGTYEASAPLSDTVSVVVIPFAVELDLAAGWNMVSLPVVPEYYNVDSLFPDNVGAFGWDGTDYVVPEVFEIGHGYWLALLEPQTVVLSGIPVMTYTRNMNAGWNMVGSIALETDTSGFEDSPPEVIIPQSLQWYDPVLGIYVITGMIDPGKGYWLPSLEAGTLTLSTVPAAKQPIVPAEEVTPFATLRATQGRISRTLEFGFGSAATTGFDRGLDKPVPPSGPFGHFDAYFTIDHELFTRVNRDVRPSGTNSTWTLELKGQTEVTLEWDVSAIPSELDVAMMVDGKVIDMRSTESLTLRNGGRFEISVGKGFIVPSHFSLMQNYPNPFNPETEILYALPRATRTTVTVYNVLGQVVKVLVNEYQSPGSYRVQWDGRSDFGEEVASGVYFYQLQAGDFAATKRMVLMK